MSSEINNLVKKAKSGDVNSFGELYEIYAKDMFRFAYYYLGSSEYAEDTVSECIIKAFQKIATLKKTASFKSWLFKILHNCCNELLKEKIAGMQNVEYSAQLHLTADNNDSSEIIALKNALLRLDEEEREIIILYYCSGYTSKEIGEIMKLKPSTVRSKIMRGNEKLHKYLDI